MVKKRTLLLIASLVWTVAGINVLRIGILEFSVVVFTVFQIFIFGRLVKKHTKRINAYTEPQLFIKFFDVKSFIIMAVMITGGILIRVLKLVPNEFIAVFYTGLGASLTMAGILFGKNFIIGLMQGKTEKEREIEK